MSMAARAMSSRAVSSTSLSGMGRAIGSPSRPELIPARGAERSTDELREALLQLGRPRLGALPRGPGPLARRDARPLPEVGVGVQQAELHRDRVDQRLEPLAELERHAVGPVRRLDARGDAPPRYDPVGGHHLWRAVRRAFVPGPWRNSSRRLLSRRTSSSYDEV